MTETANEIPVGFVLSRTTDTFDNATVPPGLLSAHRVAKSTWGRLVVFSGELTFVFDDDEDHPITCAAGGFNVIPPDRRHHLELDGPVTFAVEFYSAP